MELRARGWSISAAGRELGVSRAAANNWARGYKTYPRGAAVGFVPALDRLAVRQISDRYLSEEERIAAGFGPYPGSYAAIAAETASTDGSRRTAGRLQGTARRHRRRVDRNPALCELIAELLAQRWSPNRSPGTCDALARWTGRCGCAIKAAIKALANA
jgi:IS30 family transposase